MTWQNLTAQAAEEGISSRIVAMEVIQLQLLSAIFARTESVGLSFQGGTALRLVHGGHRYSEDLDFVDEDTESALLDRMMRTAARTAAERLAAALGPGDGNLDPMKDGPSVLSWWFRYQRRDAREVLRVKLEVGRFPARDVSIRMAGVRTFSFLPPALVRVCSPRELLADKINALAQRQYVKGRDLYDIWFLRSLGVKPEPELVRTKFRDYGTEQPFERLRMRLDQVTSEDVRGEMERFLPVPVRQHLALNDYAEVMTAVRETVREVLE